MTCKNTARPVLKVEIILESETYERNKTRTPTSAEQWRTGDVQWRWKCELTLIERLALHGYTHYACNRQPVVIIVIKRLGPRYMMAKSAFTQEVSVNGYFVTLPTS